MTKKATMARVAPMRAGVLERVMVILLVRRGLDVCGLVRVVPVAF
jgi:hypothetical protein